MVVAIQSYTRAGWMMRGSVERALRELEIDHVDLLCLGWWNGAPPGRILDAAHRLVESGKVRHLMISCHDRPQFEALARLPGIESIMVRYNAAHTGAEREVFPQVEATGTGVLAFTATRWGSLVKQSLTPEGEKTPRGRDCYRFVLSNPNVHASLCGPSSGQELEEAMAALDEGPMSADELAWMRRVGATVRGGAKKRPLDYVDAVRGGALD
jgi:aryl-alcohol dehydrogenase-like predicted oxidoreductase